jgi:hypothetical protein
MECFAKWPFPHPHDMYLWLDLWKWIKMIIMIWWWHKQYQSDISMQMIWLQHSGNYGRMCGSIFRDDTLLSYCSSIIPKTIQTQLLLSLKQSCFHKHICFMFWPIRSSPGGGIITICKRKHNQYWKWPHLYIMLSY